MQSHARRRGGGMLSVRHGRTRHSGREEEEAEEAQERGGEGESSMRAQEV